MINDKFHIVYLDNVIFLKLQCRLSDRNYGCRRRPIFNIAKMCLPPGLCPGPHRGASSWQTMGLIIWEGPAELRDPRPRDPTISHFWLGNTWCQWRYIYFTYAEKGGGTLILKTHTILDTLSMPTLCKTIQCNGLKLINIAKYACFV